MLNMSLCTSARALLARGQISSWWCSLKVLKGLFTQSFVPASLELWKEQSCLKAKSSFKCQC